ncbi:DUF3854 domain-containing protein [bacterium]|nr:DUF3854 domain-containing protein [bacterium]
MSSNRLAPAHLADLKRSGLSDDTITAMGCESLDATSIARWVYGPDSDKSLAYDGYSIPYRDLSGNPMKDGTGAPMVRYRMMLPPGEEAPKYRSRSGAHNRIFLPPGLAELLNDPVAPLIITEGEKKAAKAVQEGFACVGIAGIWNWAAEPKRNEDERLSPETRLIAELYEICRNRKVLVLGDCDPKESTQATVKKGLSLLARAILVQIPTKAVNFAFIPKEYAGPESKMGLDDLLMLEGA